jgi:hypothetical protein
MTCRLTHIIIWSGHAWRIQTKQKTRNMHPTSRTPYINASAGQADFIKSFWKSYPPKKHAKIVHFENEQLSVHCQRRNIEWLLQIISFYDLTIYGLLDI